MSRAGERAAALEVLGLGPDASEDEVLAAYRKHAGPLKRQLVNAPSVAIKDATRRDLLRVVRARDAALGRSSVEERMAGVAVEAGPLVARLEGLPRRVRRAEALAALDLGADASRVRVRAVYSAGYRALTREMARARDEPELERYREARRRMRLLERLLLPPVPPPPPAVVRERPKAAPVTGDPLAETRLDLAELVEGLGESRFDVSDLVKGLDESGFDVSEVMQALGESGLDVSELIQGLERSRLDLSGIVIDPARAPAGPEHDA